MTTPETIVAVRSIRLHFIKHVKLVRDVRLRRHELLLAVGEMQVIILSPAETPSHCGHYGVRHKRVAHATTNSCICIR